LANVFIQWSIKRRSGLIGLDLERTRAIPPSSPYYSNCLNNSLLWSATAAVAEVVRAVWRLKLVPLYLFPIRQIYSELEASLIGNPILFSLL